MNYNYYMLNHKTIDRINRDIYKKKKIIKLVYKNYYSLIKNNLLKKRIITFWK
jgi:hypothetical protein